jgi:hypothetical protein
MPSNAASAAVALASTGGASLVSGYGDLLKYGVSGLVVVILLISFGSLRTFQRTAAEKDVTKDYITRFFWLQCIYVAAAIIMFVIAVFAPREPVNVAHRIAFSLSPSLFEKDELVPRLVVAGGAPVAFHDGTGQDTFTGERAYQFSVDALARDRDYYKNLFVLSQTHASVDQGGGHDAKDNR